MTDEQLTAIEQRANAATQGPWRVVHEDDEMCMNLYAVAHADVDVDTETRDLANVICANLVQVPKTINHRSDCLHPNWWSDVDFIAAARSDVPALVKEVRRLQAEIDKHKQWEQMAVDHFGDVESAGMAAHSEALILFESMKAQLYPESEATPDQTTVGVVLQISNMVAGLRNERNHLRREVERFELIGDDADTIESLIHRLRLTMDDGDLHGVDEQIPQMRFILREAIAPLVAETKRLRADIERIGHERDRMVAANVELQTRLSALEDDGK